MQYPIIDLITDAYLNNGWTGLDISTGKNLLDIQKSESGGIDASGNLLPGNQLWRSTDFIDVESSTSYVFSTVYSGLTLTLRIYYYDENHVYLTRVEGYAPSLLFTTPLNCKFIKWSLRRSNADITRGYVNDGDFQIEQGTQATPYEPYGVAKNDFPNRLKLPLPHYFPHPVIDALQRAAAGTQTADDTEILRHYLTPLGIGGI